jgi:hypothetical protein
MQFTHFKIGDEVKLRAADALEQRAFSQWTGMAVNLLQRFQHAAPTRQALHIALLPSQDPDRDVDQTG